MIKNNKYNLEERTAKFAESIIDLVRQIKMKLEYYGRKRKNYC